MKTVRARSALLAAAVLLVALAVRVGQVQTSAYTPINDAKLYVNLASAVARTGDYVSSTKPGTGSGGSRGPSALFPPAFPYFLAMVDLLDGHTTVGKAGVEPARISQAALGTIATGLIGLVALEAFGGAVALVALALAAIYPVLVETSGTLIAENLLLVFELAAVYCGLRIRRSARPYVWVVLAGASTGLAALTHQNGLVLLPPLLVAAWSAFFSRTSRMGALWAPAALTLAMVLTIMPWTLRNAVELGSFIPISDQTGETLFGTYNAVSAADRQVPYKWRPPYRVTSAKALVDEAPRLREPVWEGRLLSQAFRYIGAHPLSPLKVSFVNALQLLDLDGSFAWETSTASIGVGRTTAEIGVLSFWVLAMLAIVGALTSCARRAPHWIWAVPILFVLSTIWIRAETPRYRLPIEPFVVLLAACGLVALGSRLRERQAQRKAPVTASPGATEDLPAGDPPATAAAAPAH